VVAIGGNALADPHDPQDLARQAERAADLAGPLARLLEKGIHLVVVHGNGPQVGARLIQGEAARGQVPPSPLHVCVAETQGEIGHYLTLALNNELRRQAIEAPVVALVTHVLVDRSASEFLEPDKPVGPVYPVDEAARLASERGWRMTRVPGGERRVVPSPRPLAVLEVEAVELMLVGGCCIIAGGGGGIALTRDTDDLRPEDAVVDKDYVAERLATALEASRLIILTDVPGAALSFAGANPHFLRRLSAKEARHYLEHGEFAPGSMGPKVEACVEFVEAGGDEALIAAIEDAAAAFDNRVGTRITVS
jgi:carbamate kinase